MGTKNDPSPPPSTSTSFNRRPAWPSNEPSKLFCTQLLALASNWVPKDLTLLRARHKTKMTRLGSPMSSSLLPGRLPPPPPLPLQSILLWFLLCFPFQALLFWQQSMPHDKNDLFKLPSNGLSSDGLPFNRNHPPLHPLHHPLSPAPLWIPPREPEVLLLWLSRASNTPKMLLLGPRGALSMGNFIMMNTSMPRPAPNPKTHASGGSKSNSSQNSSNRWSRWLRTMMVTPVATPPISLGSKTQTENKDY